MNKERTSEQDKVALSPQMKKTVTGRVFCVGLGWL